MDILRTCEELRHTRAFDESTRAKLREPGKEFALFRDEMGRWRFRAARYHAQTAAICRAMEPVLDRDQPFRTQPLRLRLEALMSAAPLNAPGNILLMDLSDPKAWTGTPRGANGVSLTVAGSPGAADPAAWLVATNAGKVAQTGSWARIERRFDPCLNLKNHQAVGVWVEGDGLGELLAIRLESPRHLSFGAVADRYLTLDFTGRRFCALVETESTRWSDYDWGDGKGLYNVYRETINFDAVESVSLSLNNLPPGREARCLVGPVTALPMVIGKARNPLVTINGATIQFPVEMTSGTSLEFNSPDDCTLFGSKGETLAKVIPRGEPPSLAPGANRVLFSCDQPEPPAPRVRTVLITHGDPL